MLARMFVLAWFRSQKAVTSLHGRGPVATRHIWKNCFKRQSRKTIGC